jgi:hypothetical protein
MEKKVSLQVLYPRCPQDLTKAGTEVARRSQPHGLPCLINILMSDGRSDLGVVRPILIAQDGQRLAL